MNRFPWQNYSDERLLKVRLKDLGVTIEGTWLEGCVAQLYEELDARVSGVGTIWYVGSPNLRSKVSGVGSIKQKFLTH